MLKSFSQVTHWLSTRLGIHRSIAKKISVGYTLALGTAVIGTVSGLMGGFYYEYPARMQKQRILKKKQLLNDFENQLLKLEMHPLRILSLAGKDTIWLQYEISQHHSDHRLIEQLLVETEQLAASDEQISAELTVLLEDSRFTIHAHHRFSQELWAQIDGVNEKKAARELISETLSSDRANLLSTQFEKLFEKLTRLQQTADQRYGQATARLEQAERLRLMIIVTSMVLSIGFAIVLAAFTSRAIAKPIEQLTTVARQVTRDGNFQLQADIHTQDEVALLANALNQLVSWTGEYTHELNNARQHLELRVQERTVALQQSEASLRQQTEDLQQALVDLQQAQLRLIQSEKMSSLGQMVAGIAHEINNPVSFIYGNLEHALGYTDDVIRLLRLYQESYPNPTVAIQDTIEDIDLSFLQDDFPKLIYSMQNGTDRIRDIVQSLRTFSRLDEAAVKHVDLHDGIESTLVILNNRLKPTANSPEIQVIRHYGKLTPVECYAGQLNQVFMNILSNAIDALKEAPRANPTITITTYSIDPEWVAIHVADNGPGIPDAIGERLFDPFFTTKSVGEGTGMGLSISYQIVTEKHNGHLSYRSAVEQGAEFVIKLPVVLHG
ncbi:ATP-binding protein [Leptothoe kymatousa]|uniref:HAMP domain-containing protein n=2 Tax=Leptothoe TaxID=2651725 RepID=A0ABS5Y6M3_9CYAN|nr:ATP-binding protein [Leptothoe kymatousa]MBT9313475.1 HAMP domain-containing protein [Leptothoe kymatousa TAU-MAC 1615]